MSNRSRAIFEVFIWYVMFCITCYRISLYITQWRVSLVKFMRLLSSCRQHNNSMEFHVRSGDDLYKKTDRGIHQWAAICVTRRRFQWRPECSSQWEDRTVAASIEVRVRGAAYSNSEVIGAGGALRRMSRFLLDGDKCDRNKSWHDGKLGWKHRLNAVLQVCDIRALFSHYCSRKYVA